MKILPKIPSRGRIRTLLTSSRKPSMPATFPQLLQNLGAWGCIRRACLSSNPTQLVRAEPKLAVLFMSLLLPPCFSPIGLRWAHTRHPVGPLDVSAQSKTATPGLTQRTLSEHLPFTPPPQSGLRQRPSSLQTKLKQGSANSLNSKSSDHQLLPNTTCPAPCLDEHIQDNLWGAGWGRDKLGDWD